MGFWKKQPAADPPVTAPSARPASRHRADETRRKAQRYTDLTEHPGDQDNDRRKATRQRKQAEREMAALRAKTVQARRLAGQIENLHQPIPAQRKGRIMSTTIADPGQAQRMARRTTDKPSPVGGQLNFNPLHPSMELPPEQLIRLLGLEHKTKRRKKHPKLVAATRARKNSPTETTAVSEPVKLSLPKTTPACAERERDTVAQPFGDSRRRLIIPALVVGAVAGIAISAYLFLGDPEDATPSVTQSLPAPEMKKAARPLPSTAKPAPAPVPAAAPSAKTRQGTVQRDNVAIPQIEIEAEEKRLRNEAEQRFSGRVAEQVILPEQKTLNADTALPAVTEPAVDMNTTESSDSLDVTRPPEPVTREPQDDTSQNEISAEEIPTEQETARAAAIPAETATMPAEADPVPAEQTAPGVMQDDAPEAAVNEALF